MPHVVFKVKLKLPKGATSNDAKQYVREALWNWGGSLEPPHTDSDGNDLPGDPFFGQHHCTIKLLKEPS